MIRIRKKGKEAELSINIVKECPWDQLEVMVKAVQETTNGQLDSLIQQTMDKSKFTEVKFDALGDLHCKKAYVARGKPAKDKEGEE